jgi:hypothetical protein
MAGKSQLLLDNVGHVLEIPDRLLRNDFGRCLEDGPFIFRNHIQRLLADTEDDRQSLTGLDQQILRNLTVCSDLAGTTTDALAQGATNKYWSNTLFDTRLSATTSLPNIITLANLSLAATQLTNFGVPVYQYLTATTTSALAEGANKYFTDARADVRINATTSIGTLTAAPNLATVGTIGTSTFSLKSDTSSNLGFFTAASGGGSQAMTITSSGNVGIGTANPSSILTVNGGADSQLNIAATSPRTAQQRLRSR